MEFRELVAERQEQLRQIHGEGPILVSSSSVEILRQACKSKKVALLLNRNFHPDIGLLRDAKEHCKPFIIPISMLLGRSGIERGAMMARMRYFLTLCVQVGATFILFAGGNDELLRRPEEELAAIGECLGLSHDQSVWSIRETPKLVK